MNERYWLFKWGEQSLGGMNDFDSSGSSVVELSERVRLLAIEKKKAYQFQILDNHSMSVVCVGTSAGNVFTLSQIGG